MFRVVSVQAGLSPPGELTEQWISDVARVREVLYGNYDKNKPTIWIVGGSNTLFGIDSSVIAKRTGYNVKNYSLHASMHIDILLSQIKDKVSKGDIVVVSTEWSAFNNKLGSVYDYTNYLRHLSGSVNPPLSVLMRLYLSVPLSRWVDGLTHYVYRPADELPYWEDHSIGKLLDQFKVHAPNKLNLYSITSLNEDGDFNIEAPMTRWTWQIQDHLPIPLAVSKEALSRRTYWADQFQNDGARFVSIAPVILENSSKQITTPDFWGNVESIRVSLAKGGVPLYCDPTDAVLSTIYRLDTFYHPNAEGARIRSEKLADCLSKVIAGSDMRMAPIDSSSSAKRASEVLEQQKNNFGQGSMRFQRILRSLTKVRTQLELYRASHGEYPEEDFFEGLEIDDRDDLVLSSKPRGYYIGANPSPQTALECAVIAANWPSMIVLADPKVKDLTLCLGYGFTGSYPAELKRSDKEPQTAPVPVAVAAS